jgi:NADH-quinone oxidoreductase subunit E
MPVAEPVAPVGEPIPPTAEPATTAVEPVAEPEAAADMPPPGTGVSERVREAARAAREAAADLAGPAPEATRPAALEAPRDGKADDLKKIKGVGPKLEELLHSLGIYHFGQIAAWGPSEVAWMDSNLEGFFGRVTRDDWVGQAKVLAAGDETEFSKRVDEGDVY